MTEQDDVRVLEYRQDEPRDKAKRRRVLYCVALPMIGFGLASGFWGDRTLNGSCTAVGALLVAFALPVRE